MAFGGGSSFSFGSNNNQGTGFSGFGNNNNNSTPSKYSSLLALTATHAYPPGAFGSTSNTGGFGSTSTTNNPFATNTGGSSTFGSNTGGGMHPRRGRKIDLNANDFTTGFGSNSSGGGLFGNKTTGTSLFGSTNTSSNTGGGLFGNTASNTTSGFGSSTGGFGSNNTTAFGNNNNNASTTGFSGFGSTANKPAFGSGSSGTTLFGQGGAGTTGAFGNSGGNGFGGSGTALGQAVGPAQGTGNVPFNAVSEKDTNGTVNYQSISFMENYNKYSPEELRIADYNAGRKFGNGAGQPAGAFGSSAFGGGGFGSNNTSTGFGSNNATSTNLFGTNNSSTTGAFGNNAGSTFGNNSGGLFGQNKPAATTGGLFGNQSSTTNTTGGLFGTSNNTSSGGLFGNNSNTSTAGGFGSSSGGGLFGNNNNNTQSKPGGLFGNNSATTSGTTGFSFGNNNSQPQNNTTGGGLFGNNNQTTSGGLFGNNNSQQKPGGLFGNASTGGGFGSTNTAQPSGGLFGTSNNTASTGGGLFGNNNATGSTSTGGGLFGNTQSNTSSGGLFGNNNANSQAKPGGLFGGSTFGNQQQSNTGGGLFGNNNTTTQTSTGGGLFGNNNSNNTGSGFSFGTSQNKPAGSSLFGNTSTTNNQSGGLFGSTANSAFGNSMNQSQMQPQGDIKHSSLLDSNPYGQSSIWTGLPSPTEQNSKPLVTPLTASQSLRDSQARPPPNLRLNQSRYMTPPRRGYGFTYSTYGTPNSAASTPGGNSLSTSMYGSRFTGGSFGRSMGKSASIGNMRSYYSEGESVLAPGAFTPSSSRYSSGSIRRLTIDRSIRDDLFSRPSLPGPSNSSKTASPAPPKPASNTASTAPAPVEAAPEAASGKLKKRVSFDKDTAGGQNGELNSTTGAVVVRAEDDVEDTPPANSAVQPPEANRNNALAAVPEDRESEHVSVPKGQTDTRDPQPGDYWSVPTEKEIQAMSRDQAAHYKGFTVGRKACGQVIFDAEVDLKSLLPLSEKFGKIIDISVRSVAVYPDSSTKPQRGKGLNVPSIISIENSWPRRKGKGEAVGSGPSYDRHIRRLKAMENAEFVSYDHKTGVWTFKVPHYTRYGLDYDDDEDEEEAGESY
jgi:nuclear pore complex protein Nup98-Nup96